MSNVYKAHKLLSKTPPREDAPEQFALLLQSATEDEKPKIYSAFRTMLEVASNGQLKRWQQEDQS